MSSRFSTDYIIAESDSNVLGEPKGTKHILWFSYLSIISASSGVYAGEVLTVLDKSTYGKGICLNRSCSLTGAIVNYDVKFDVTGTFNIYQGTGLGFPTMVNTLDIGNLVGTDYVESSTQARNTDKFAAGDILIPSFNVSGQICKITVGVEVIYDD